MENFQLLNNSKVYDNHTYKLRNFMTTTLSNSKKLWQPHTHKLDLVIFDQIVPW